jgi:CBS domain-containing protein
MEVEKVMTPGVRTCSSNDTLNQAARIMWECDCGAVPVVDENGRVIAVITDRDICMAAYFQGKPLAQMAVSSAASHGVVTVERDEGVETAEALMRQHQVRRIPVVDHNGVLCGMLSMSDLARCIQMRDEGESSVSPEDVARTLAAVSQPHRFAADQSSAPQQQAA